MNAPSTPDDGPQRGSPAPAPSPERILRIVWFTVFASNLFYRAVDPIIPKIADDLAVPVATVALLATAFALPWALIQPVMGTLADLLGRTRMMAICLFLVTVSTLAAAFATSFSMLLVTRVLAGIAAGGVFPSSLAITADLVPMQWRQVAISRVLAAAMLGNLLGSSAAGVVADLIGWRGVFLVNGSIGAVAFVTAFFGFAGVREQVVKFDFASIVAGYRTIFTNPLAKFCFAAVFLEGTFLFGLFPYVAPLLQAEGEERASIAGLIIAAFGLGGIIYSFVIPFLLPRLGQRPLMIGGGLLMGLGLMTMALRPYWPVQVSIFTMFGLAFYLLHGVIQLFVTELAPAARGAAAAVHSSCFFLGQSVGPVLYRFGLADAGLTPTLIFSGLVLIATGLVCAQKLRHRPR